LTDDSEKRELERARAEAFVDPVTIPFQPEFSQAEFDQIVQGFEPQAMEDKWAVIFQEPYLNFVRSWTGIGIYRLEFQQTAAGYKVVSAVMNRERLESDGIEYSAALVDFLLSNLLLGLSKPFPKRDDMANDPLGLYQHHVAGTGFPEVRFAKLPAEKPWWKIW
jgi:hypothetical protein